MKNKRRIVWTRRARENLRSIRDYVASDSPRSADRFVERVLDCVNRVAQFPDAGAVVPEFPDGTVREIFVGAYRIVYRIGERSVEVVTVRHASRQFDLDD